MEITENSRYGSDQRERVINPELFGLISGGLMIDTIIWEDRQKTNHQEAASCVHILDQTKLPLETVYLECTHWEQVADAISRMCIRGAPAIGVAAAMGVALGAQGSKAEDFSELSKELEVICQGLSKTRPTAVNLFWALDKMRRAAESMGNLTIAQIKERLRDKAVQMWQEDIDICRRIGKHGADLIPEGASILTHCNAGALATAGYGTALGVVRAAHSQGKNIRVYADETRPFLQGARLTAWELHQEGIPVTLITDNMAGHFMSRGKISVIVVGADRIAANGDVANKIGTYTVAVLARENGIPFYVAAPRSTLDLSLSSGADIPIEERDPNEVTHFHGYPIAPAGVVAAHPAFDVTPARYVTAIITEDGISRPPYNESLAK